MDFLNVQEPRGDAGLPSRDLRFLLLEADGFRFEAILIRPAIFQAGVALCELFV